MRPSLMLMIQLRFSIKGAALALSRIAFDVGKSTVYCKRSLRRLLSSRRVYEWQPPQMLASQSRSLRSHLASAGKSSLGSALVQATGDANSELERVAMFAGLELPACGSEERSRAYADLRSALVAARTAAAYASSRLASRLRILTNAEVEALSIARVAELRNGESSDLALPDRDSASCGQKGTPVEMGAAALLQHAAKTDNGFFAAPRARM